MFSHYSVFGNCIFSARHSHPSWYTLLCEWRLSAISLRHKYNWKNKVLRWTLKRAYDMETLHLFLLRKCTLFYYMVCWKIKAPDKKIWHEKSVKNNEKHLHYIPIDSIPFRCCYGLLLLSPSNSSSSSTSTITYIEKHENHIIRIHKGIHGNRNNPTPS